MESHERRAHQIWKAQGACAMGDLCTMMYKIVCIASYTCTCMCAPQTSRVSQMLGMYGYDSAECVHVALLLYLYDFTV